MKPIVIFGFGGMGRCARMVAEDMGRSVHGFIDDRAPQGNPPGYLGGTSWLEQNRDEFDVVVAIGDPAVRQRVVEKLQAIGVKNFPHLIHPSCVLPKNWRPGQGSILCPGACIDPDVTVREFVIINTLCSVGHDAVLEDFCTLSPAVNLGGAVKAGRGAFFGINSATIQGLGIGAWAKVGAGSTVLKNVPEGCTVVGTPARPIGGAR